MNYNGLKHYWPLNGINDDLVGDAHLTSFGVKNSVLDPAGNTVVYLNRTYYQLPADVYFYGSFTITSWYRSDTFIAYKRLLDCGKGISSDNIILTLGNDNRNSIMFFSFIDSHYQSIVSPEYSPNKWYFLAATFNGTHGTIYLNGTKVAEGTLHMPANITRTKCYIGASNWPSDPFADAYIGDFKIYDRCLSFDDVINEFN